MLIINIFNCACRPPWLSAIQFLGLWHNVLLLHQQPRNCQELSFFYFLFKEAKLVISSSPVNQHPSVRNVSRDVAACVRAWARTTCRNSSVLMNESRELINPITTCREPGVVCESQRWVEIQFLLLEMIFIRKRNTFQCTKASPAESCDTGLSKQWQGAENSSDRKETGERETGLPGRGKSMTTGDNLFEILGRGGGGHRALWGCLESYARQSPCKSPVRSETGPMMFA